MQSRSLTQSKLQLTVQSPQNVVYSAALTRLHNVGSKSTSVMQDVTPTVHSQTQEFDKIETDIRIQKTDSLLAMLQSLRIMRESSAQLRITTYTFQLNKYHSNKGRRIILTNLDSTVLLLETQSQRTICVIFVSQSRHCERNANNIGFSDYKAI